MFMEYIKILPEISKNIAIKSVFIIILISFLMVFTFPQISYLAYAENRGFLNTLPQAETKELKLVKTINMPVTAYSSTVDQCDSTPCITANGFNLCENNKQNVIASNYLPFGTKVKFPDYDPDTIYTVQDRMNARYYQRADIWMKTRSEAIAFGYQNLKMEIYEY